MQTYKGKSVYGGIAVGKIHIIKKKERLITRRRPKSAEEEIARFEAARTNAKEQLAELYGRAVAEVGETNAAIFEIHRMMLDDDDYIEAVHSIISDQTVNAEYAAAVTADNFAEMFSAMDDAYMKERAADVKDISERIIGILTNSDGRIFMGGEPQIILADDLTPSETVQLDKSLVLAFVTVHGSTNSHTAILARTMNIPALIGVKLDISDNLEGKTAVVDGFNGVMYIEPSDECLREAECRLSEEKKKHSLLQKLKGKENITKDGKSVMLYANIGNIKDLAYAKQNDAGGIGLFRSEFIYMESVTYPTEEEQFRIYKKAAESMSGKRVIVRTLDIGADKQADYFNLGKEENPALGLRAIRLCLKRPEIFRTQLRALCRASHYGKIAIMYPMITSVGEVRKIKEISAGVRAELTAEGIPLGETEEGIMIETPAAVMISDLLAKEVDFFSIGTNDLSQYTMAIDRQNQNLEEFFDPHHEAVMRMIELVCKNAHAENKWVGICGELGADLELTERFLRMGIDELSVSPSCILPVRNRIRSLDLGDGRGV